MLVATFNETTGWAGRTITFETDVFLLEGQSILSAENVMDYDADGCLRWAGEGMRAWVASRAKTPDAPQGRGRTPLWVWVLCGSILLALVIAGIAIQGASPQVPLVDLPTPTAKTTWTTVFTWSGGGVGNDIRNSAPFTFSGGHQRVSVSTQQFTGEGGDPLTGWTLESADGAGEWESINPGLAAGASDLFLPAGSYYLSSNTIDCSWTVTVQEEH